ncbi:MAG: hypothetical protein SGI92_08470 [Bryobacteraceae bacterium]|nr:hypothetical protein [Bryobacteraceae bacterium]
MPDHRLFPREQAASIGLLTVYRITPLGNRQRIGSSLLVDVSKGGVGTKLDFPVRVGEILFLQNKTFERHVVVRHRWPLPVGYQVGLKFCAPPAHDKEAVRGSNAKRLPLRGPTFF